MSGKSIFNNGWRQISIRLAADVYAKAQREASKREISAGAWIRERINQALQYDPDFGPADELLAEPEDQKEHGQTENTRS